MVTVKVFERHCASLITMPKGRPPDGARQQLRFSNGSNGHYLIFKQLISNGVPHTLKIVYQTFVSLRTRNT